VWLETRKALGEDLVGRNLRRDEFKDLVSKYLDCFENGEIVRELEWLAGV